MQVDPVRRGRYRPVARGGDPAAGYAGHRAARRGAADEDIGQRQKSGAGDEEQAAVQRRESHSHCGRRHGAVSDHIKGPVARHHIGIGGCRTRRNGCVTAAVALA